MDNNDFKLEESGINPVDTAGSDKDVYFSNVETNTASSAGKTAAVKKSAPKKKKGKKRSKHIHFLYCCNSLFNDYFGLCRYVHE